MKSHVDRIYRRTSWQWLAVILGMVCMLTYFITCVKQQDHLSAFCRQFLTPSPSNTYIRLDPPLRTAHLAGLLNVLQEKLAV